MVGYRNSGIKARQYCGPDEIDITVTGKTVTKNTYINHVAIYSQDNGPLQGSINRMVDTGILFSACPLPQGILYHKPIVVRLRAILVSRLGT